MRIAVYTGSFDPLTNGHLWMIRTAAALFDRLFVSIGDNPDKKYTFSRDDRLTTLCASVKGLSNVFCSAFRDQYLVNFAEACEAQYIIRGIRDTRDYEFERGMRHVNADLQPSINTVFLIPPRDISEVSSSLVKGLIGPVGWQEVVRRYVPEPVYDLILSKYAAH